MTIEQIRAKRAELQSKIRELQIQIDHVRLDMSHLQIECQHPAGHWYRDIAGDMSFDCPDCGKSS